MSLTTTVTDRAAEFLGKRTSRRGFLTRTALVGSAVTTAGVTYATRPTSAYAAVCGCNGRTCDCTDLCCDGYTEFCCRIYGSNTCPPNTILAGWWKVDNSSFCSGAARYYMDCNKASPGCRCGSSGVCRDGTACQCRSCGDRKDGCTVFRYGNCNNQVSCVGPIMCRVVTCTKPWEIDPGCSTTARTDNNTRWHHRPCLEEGSTPDPVNVFATGNDDLWQRYWRSGHGWSGWVNLGGHVVGGVGSIARDSKTIDVFTVGGRGENRLVWKYWRSGRWSGWRDMGHPPSVGLSPHAPGVCFRQRGRAIDIFAVGNDGRLWQRYWRAGSGWSGWVYLGGNVVGGVGAIARDDRTVDVFAVGGRGGNRLVWKYWRSGRWSGWRDMGHPPSVGLSPHAVGATFRHGGRSIDLFAAGNDGRLWQRYWRAGSGWSGWADLGGNVVGGVGAVARDDQTIDVFAVGGSGGNQLVWKYWRSGRWSGWRGMGHPRSVSLSPHAPSAGSL